MRVSARFARPAGLFAQVWEVIDGLFFQKVKMCACLESGGFTRPFSCARVRIDEKFEIGVHLPATDW